MAVFACNRSKTYGQSLAMTIVFRRAKTADVSSIAELLADDQLAAIREDLNAQAAYEAAFMAVDSDPNQLLAVIDCDNEVVGCLQLTFIPGLTRKGMWRGQIEGVRVAASHRDKGLGREFLEWAINECRNRGCGLVQLTTDKRRSETQRFYESLGFKASHEGMKLSFEKPLLSQ